MVELIDLTIHKMYEKYQVIRLNRIKKLINARLEALEEAIDGPFDREVSQQLDQVNEWVGQINDK